MSACTAAPTATTWSGRLAAEELADGRSHKWHSRGAADHHDVLDVASVDAGVGEGALARAERALDHVPDKVVVLLSRYEHPPIAIHAWYVEPGDGLTRVAQTDLRRFRFPSCQRPEVRVVVQTGHAEFFRCAVDHPLCQTPVEIVSAQARIAVGREHLEDAALQA